MPSTAPVRVEKSNLLFSIRVGQRFFRFHSISFPSEWESLRDRMTQLVKDLEVSIQLVFPASGKDCPLGCKASGVLVSIQLVFPASGKARPKRLGRRRGNRSVSIQLVFPASGKDNESFLEIIPKPLMFPFN